MRAFDDPVAIRQELDVRESFPVDPATIKGLRPRKWNSIHEELRDIETDELERRLLVLTGRQTV